MLDGFVQERKQGKERILVVKGSRKLAKMEQAFAPYLADCAGRRLEDDYKEAEKAARKIAASASEIEAFSLKLAKYQEEKGFSWCAGMFLSALINNSPGRDFTVVTNHLDMAIEYLGYRNKKNITVQGDLYFINFYLSGGHLIIEGNARLFAGLGAYPDTSSRGVVLYKPEAKTDYKVTVKGKVIFQTHSDNLVSKDFDTGLSNYTASSIKELFETAERTWQESQKAKK